MSKELHVLALNGDEDALKQLREMASQRGENLIIMQRLLQVHFQSHDGKKWRVGPCIWSPWHQAQPGEPPYYIDATEGKAFRTIKKERQITFVEARFLDPEEIPLLLEKSQELRESLDKLRQRLKEAVEKEKYEDAAKIRDEINYRLGPRPVES